MVVSSESYARQRVWTISMRCPETTRNSPVPAGTQTKYLPERSFVLCIWTNLLCEQHYEHTLFTWFKWTHCVVKHVPVNLCYVTPVGVLCCKSRIRSSVKMKGEQRAWRRNKKTDECDRWGNEPIFKRRGGGGYDEGKWHDILQATKENTVLFEGCSDLLATKQDYMPYTVHQYAFRVSQLS
jgi:hypothetical protein